MHTRTYYVVRSIVRTTLFLAICGWVIYEFATY